jgi:hypothetical protein
MEVKRLRHRAARVTVSRRATLQTPSNEEEETATAASASTNTERETTHAIHVRFARDSPITVTAVSLPDWLHGHMVMGTVIDSTPPSQR